MQTVNFNCPHCGNLMAVGTNLLGRNVRCPHCKQVVRAPAAAGEPPSPQVPVPTPPPPGLTPQFNVPVHTEHHESIFGEVHDEDVFGTQPLKPTIPAMPVPPTPATLLEETAYAPPPLPPQSAPAPTYSETLTYETPAAPMPEYEPLQETAPTYNEPPRRPERQEPVGGGYRARPAKPETPATPAFAWILLAYSALITIVAGVLAYMTFVGSEGKSDHPFKAIPDFYGQYEKANRKSLSFNGMPDPKGDVPADLRVKLGEEITVGDIQVRPTAVTKQVMERVVEDAVKGESSAKAGVGLSLTIQIKNVSTDTTLFPNDPAFNRALDKEQPVPYTALQINREYFYGPFAWPMDEQTKENYLAGYAIPKEPLRPGQEQVTWVTLAPQGMRSSADRRIGDTLKELKPETTCLWRVQLRRGLVKAKSEGKDVDVSATCVIGVEFRPDQIKDR